MLVKFLYRKDFDSISPTDGTLSIKNNLLSTQFLVVQNELGFVGVLTPEDLSKRPYNLVLDCLSPKPSVSVDADLDSTLAKMNQEQVSALPVFHNNKFSGVILHSDILDFYVEDKKNLEKKVLERTVALERANEELKSEIEERKKVENALRKSKNEWQNLFDSITEIVTIQDTDMRIVQANKAAAQLFDVNPEDLINRYCYEVFRGVDRPCSDCPLTKTIKNSSKKHSEIITHKSLGKTFLVSSAAIENESGNTQYLVHTAQDITEQKRLEKELFQSHKMEAIGTLAGGIAHDFNNVLSAIIGYTELAKAELAEGSGAAEDLAEVLRASKRATGLVKQILTFSRKGAHQCESLQPYLIVKEALKMMRASLPATIKMVDDVDPESGAILADPTKIHQVIVNLCTNALHAMKEETGTLTITLLRKELNSDDVAAYPEVTPGPFIELTVSDTGCGMDQETQRRIFEPYFTTKGKGKGTGLGLAVIHGIVQDYKGMIKVESERGKGSSFQVYFPALTEETQKTERAEKERSLPKGTERILTVDDESTIVELHKAYLSRLGYIVTAKTSSTEALAAFRTDPTSFDLLITDQTMPDLSGAKLAEEVLHIRPDMPIVICTGYSTLLSKEKAIEIGIRKYFTKPVDNKELARIVRSVLDEK